MRSTSRRAALTDEDLAGGINPAIEGMMLFWRCVYRVLAGRQAPALSFRGASHSQNGRVSAETCLHPQNGFRPFRRRHAGPTQGTQSRLSTAGSRVGITSVNEHSLISLTFSSQLRRSMRKINYAAVQALCTDEACMFEPIFSHPPSQRHFPRCREVDVYQRGGGLFTTYLRRKSQIEHGFHKHREPRTPRCVRALSSAQRECRTPSHQTLDPTPRCTSSACP